MLKGAPTNASIIAVGTPHTICFKLGKDTFEKHLRGKNKQREAMIEVSHAEKLQKLQTSNRTTGLMTNAGRRSSMDRLKTHKRRASDDTKINPEAEKEQDLAHTGRDWVKSGTMVDTTGDGKVDTMAFDTTNDGRLDAYLIDTTGDGNKNACLNPSNEGVSSIFIYVNLEPIPSKPCFEFLGSCGLSEKVNIAKSLSLASLTALYQFFARESSIAGTGLL